MGERKGLLTSSQEAFVAKALDQFFKFKNPLLETFDKTLFSILIKTADNNGLDKLKDEWKANIIPIIDAAMLGKVEDVTVLATTALNKHIDLPLLEEKDEQLVFDNLTKLIVSAVLWVVRKK